MNEELMYSNPFDYTMEPPMGTSCGCSGGTCQPSFATQPFPTQNIGQPYPMYSFNQPTLPQGGFSYAQPTTKENEERVIPLLIGGLLGASLARPYYPYYYPYSYPFYSPYYYGYYNYGYFRPRRRYPYYYR